MNLASKNADVALFLVYETMLALAWGIGEGGVKGEPGSQVLKKYLKRNYLGG